MGKRLIRRFAIATAGAAALVLATPGVALADSVTVSPSTVAPGGKITVHVTCAKGGDERVTVFWGPDEHKSEASHDVRLRHGSGSTTFTIPRATHPGQYVAGTHCPGDAKTTLAHFTVAPHGAPPAGAGPLSAGGGTVALLGAGVLAVATAAGTFLLMRRRADGSVG